MADGSVTIKVDLDGEKAQSGVSKLKTLLGGLGSTGSKVGSVFKSVLGANLISSALTTGISTVTGGIRGMASELTSSQKAWKTFEGNLQAFGRSPEVIKAAKTEMQDFATKTIYSASDMASTYSQLDAVGTKNVGSLVKAFGGLAASAENPAQAMKSLSTQATQMASKPKVAWMDFKIMMEQAPAGMAAVAKEMGMSTAELVSAVQDGKVKTEDFFDAMNRAGNSDAFQKMATEFKTVDQAIDGAKESLSNKLMPAFEHLNKFGIKAVNTLSNALEKVNFDKMADGLGKFLEGVDIEGIVAKISSSISSLVSKVRTFWTAFSNTGAVSAFVGAIKSIAGAVSHVWDSLTASGVLNVLASVLGSVVKWLSQAATFAANFISSLPTGAIQAITGSLVGLVVGFKAFNFLKSFNPFGLFKKNADEAIEGATNSVRRSKSTITQLFNGLSNVTKSLGTAIKNAATGIGTGLKSALTGAGTFVKGLGTAISTAAKGIGAGLGSMFRGIGQGLAMVNPATLLSLSVAILAVGAALALMGTQGAGIQSMLQGVGSVIESLGTAIGTVASMIITALGTAIATVAPALSPLSGVILAIGTAVSGVVATIGVFAPQLALLATAVGSALSGIITSISSGIAQIATALTPIVEIVSSAITQIVSVVVQGLPPIIDAVSGLVTAIADGASQIIEAVTPIVQIISDAFVQVVTVISNAIVQIVQALAPFIPAISEMVVALAPVLSQIVEAFNNLISQISPIIDSLTNLLKTFGEQVSSILTSVGGVIESFGSAVRTVLDGIAGIFESMGNAAKNAGQGVKLMAQGIKMLVDLNLGDLVATLGAVASGLGAIAATSGGLSNAGAAVKQLATSLSMVQGSGTSAASALMMLANTASTVASAISQMASVVRSAMNQAVVAVRQSMAQMLSAVKTVGSQMAVAGKQAGTQTGQGIRTGIQSQQGSIISALNAVVNAARSVAGTGRAAGHYIGSMIGQGLAEGMQSALGAVTAAANALVAEANRAAQAKAQIHSPSRLFRDSVGRYIAQGIAVGIEQNTSDVTDSLAYVQKEMSAFKFGVEELLGLGNGSLSSQFKLKSVTERAEMNQIKIIREQADQSLIRALEIAEQAVQRPVVLEAEGRTLGKLVEPIVSEIQQRTSMRNNRNRGEFA
ncbi:tape measure protein [Streptococcus merionis]|uniref:tape measure protein n=1 Tax=Streptococcus merionis TaxID=400065 RepID=UPI0035153652